MPGRAGAAAAVATRIYNAADSGAAFQIRRSRGTACQRSGSLTLHQRSDGEDTLNYVEIAPKLVATFFPQMIHPLSLLQCLWRLFTLALLSKGWRGRGF